MSVAKLQVSKAALEKERVEVRDSIKQRAAEINKELVAHGKREMLIARLRNNMKPKASELATLVGLSEKELMDIEKEAEASAKACLKKNPAWHKQHPDDSRNWTLVELVKIFKKTGKV